jgi:hypothetical protein
MNCLRFKSKIFRFAIVATVFLISGCQSTIDANPPKKTITFIDAQKFDNELTSSLKQLNEPVSVDFHNPVTPNEIPRRIDKWLAAVEKSGGKINISTPVGEPTPKDPMFLFSLFSGMWNAIKTLRGELTSNSIDDAVKNKNVNISLERNIHGNLFIQKIEFQPKDLKK